MNYFPDICLPISTRYALRSQVAGKLRFELRPLDYESNVLPFGKLVSKYLRDIPELKVQIVKEQFVSLAIVPEPRLELGIVSLTGICFIRCL
jgi:hypothetical protein